jgi:hypothetical protein
MLERGGYGFWSHEALRRVTRKKNQNNCVTYESFFFLLVCLFVVARRTRVGVTRALRCNQKKKGVACVPLFFVHVFSRTEGGKKSIAYLRYASIQLTERLSTSSPAGMREKKKVLYLR